MGGYLVADVGRIMLLFWFIQSAMLLTDAQLLTPESCEIREVAGFLQNVCVGPPQKNSRPEDLPLAVSFKCINTDQIFTVSWHMFGRSGTAAVDVLCEDDPNFYQACATRVVTEKHYLGNSQRVTTDFLPCGYLCEMGGYRDGKPVAAISDVGLRPDMGIPASVGLEFDVVCNGERSCKNTDYDEKFCKGDNNGKCDMECEDLICEDESFCNGLLYHYGVRCDDSLSYIPPKYICDGSSNCLDGTDESICRVTDTTSTCLGTSGKTLPLFNVTRCRAIVLVEHSVYDNAMAITICEDYLDQTNCTDSARVGLYCQVHGYLTTVSKQIICKNTAPAWNSPKPIQAICDDELDKACVNVSLSCYTHKHVLCDGQVDCRDGIDETHITCQEMSQVKCLRKYVHERSRKLLAIPLTWVQDGVSDCWNGEDEVTSWPKCGFGRTERLKEGLNSSCSEVFLFYGTAQFVEFSNLCDKVNSFENEKQLCEKSRLQPTIIPRAFREDVLNKTTLSHCMRGVEDIGRLKNVSCIQTQFTPNQRWVFGKNYSLEVLLPDIQTDCSHYYGELHVFLSCLGICKNSTCPLNSKGKSLKFDSCPGQFRKTKVFTVDQHSNLTLLIKNPRTGLLGNNVFLCKTSQTCLSYEKVCNLVDDCGDGSDEAACHNHFQCETSKEYIHVSQRCDQVFNCADRSDECSDTCGKTNIIRQTGFQIMAWLTGILAVFLNLIALCRTVLNLYSCKSEAALFTHSLVILINIGDFLVGVYLVLLASFDSYYGKEHCNRQIEWLTSYICVILGIISTLGAQISLFSMTILSMMRAFGVQNDSRIPKDASRRSAMKAITLVTLIFLLCFFFSYLPIIEFFEDYFVNGIKYADSNTLFVGCPDKKQHIATIKEYYGRMLLSGGYLDWSMIRKLVGDMFSRDYGGITHTTLSFYGNDPVCVFKYFVRMSDPQRNFTFITLTMNLSCFVIITASYVTIAVKSRQSVKSLNTTKDRACKTNSNSQRTDARLQRVVHAIILSDFLCWVPFTVICWLHLFSVFDGTPWYPLFSIVILPINSVMNPLLYDTSITRALDSFLVKCQSNLNRKLRRLRNRFTRSRPVNFTLKEKKSEDSSGATAVADEKQDSSGAFIEMKKEDNQHIGPSKPVQNKNSSNSSGGTVPEQYKNSNNSGEATVLEQKKNGNNSSEATVLEQYNNSNNSSEATVLEQNNNSNNSSEATVLEQNNNSNNSSEATVLEQKKNGNNSSEATVLEQNKNSNNSSEATVLEQNNNSNNSSEATVLEQNKNSNNSGEATVLERKKNGNNSSEATVLEQNKNGNNSSEATVLEQYNNSNNSSEATVLEQNNNSNNSSKATVLEQNKNSNNSSEATALEQKKNGNNSSEATVLEQNKNSNNSSEATVLEQNKNSNNSSEATVLEQNNNSNNSSEATVLEQNKNSNNSGEATVLEQNKNSNNSSEATVLEQNKNSNNSSEATVLEQKKNGNNSSEATVLEQYNNSNNSSEATVLEQNNNSNNPSKATVLEQNKNSNNSSEATVLEQNKNSNNSSEATVLEQNNNSNNSSEATVLEQNKNSNNSGEATVLEQNKNSNNSSEATVLERNKNSNNSGEATAMEQDNNGED